jgi:hypothetical protein
VYAVGHPLLSAHGRWLAAVLACGSAALLSHRSASELWGIVRSRGSHVDVTAPHRTRSGQEGIVLHLPRHLDYEDIATRDGIPITSIARTLLDLVEVVSFRWFERALEEAERLGVFDLYALDRLIERSYGRHGLRALNAALRDYRVPAFTRSELERRFLDLCLEAGLPSPATNPSSPARRSTWRGPSTASSSSSTVTSSIALAPLSSATASGIRHFRLRTTGCFVSRIGGC